MKRTLFLITGILMLMQYSTSQTNRERRLLLQDYVAPEELVSMSQSLPFDRAMLLFSDFSKRYLNKIIVDASNKKDPIGVDVENKYWLQALEDVLRANKMWYDEREEFFYVYSPADSQKAVSPAAAAGKAAIDSTSKVLFKQRDIRISSVFFTVDVVKSLNAGINWSFLYKGDTTQAGARPTQFGGEFYSGFQDPQAATGGTGGAGAQTVTQGFFARVIPAISFSNVTALISFFQNNQLGDVLSGPSITVSSGKQGRIQVGQDFYITTRDFAGNTVQQIQSAGIIINVKPTLYEEGEIKFINLDVDAERSTIGGTAGQPIINRSKATTFSVLYDGEETIIGGLYTTTEAANRGGIPFLKDLPWWVFGLRYIFGFEQTTSSTQELIILLKAEVVPTLEERFTNAAAKKNMNLIEQQRMHNASEIERNKQKK
jgi:type IV pilus assembly protein PilQ